MASIRTSAARLRAAIAGAALGCHPAIDADHAGSCGTCHADAARDWLGSAHASPDGGGSERFAVAFRRGGRDPWCASCHLPRTDGVDCVTCHAGERPGGPKLAADRCAGCHQFAVPADLRGRPGVPSSTASQDTVEEWRRSSRSGEACTTCHPPHASPGLSLLADAVSVDVRRPAPATRRVAEDPASDVVQVVLRSTGAGHAVPTGDPFRQLRLDLVGPWGLAGKARFSRRLGRDADGQWRVLADDRIPPPTDGETAELRVSVQAPDATRWTLDARLSDPAHAPWLSDGGIMHLSDGVVVAEAHP